MSGYFTAISDQVQCIGIFFFKTYCEKFFIKPFFQVPLNIISHGIAFHDHMAIEPESPYYEANYEGIRDMVLNREEILNEAAIGYAAFIGSDTDNAVMELRRKAR